MFPNDFESEFTFENAAVPLPDEPPFHVLIPGDWSGYSERTALDDRQSIEIDRDNFDDVLKKLNVGIELDLYGDENTAIHLRFEELDDFHPDNLFRKVSLFSDLRDVRYRLSDPNTFNSAAQEVRSWFVSTDDNSVTDSEIQTQVDDAPPLESNNILDLILEQPNFSSPSVKPHVTDNSELGRLVSNLISPYLIKIDENEQSKLLSTVDLAISELMRAILHHPKFLALESAWRGLYFLVRRVETDKDLKIFILDFSHHELTVNLKNINNLTDSFLYRRLIDRAYSIVGGNYSFGLNVEDVASLIRLSKIAYDFDAKFISYIKPEIFGIESFFEVQDVSQLDVFEASNEYKLWQALRNVSESDHLGLSPMRFLGRLPYGDMTDSIDTFSFEEFNGDVNFERFVWLNPCFGIALLLAQSYKIAGSKMKGNLHHDIDNLPIYIYRQNGETKTLPCAEILLTENLLEKILDQGLITLISFKDYNRIRLGRFQSVSSTKSELGGG